MSGSEERIFVQIHNYNNTTEERYLYDFYTVVAFGNIAAILFVCARSRVYASVYWSSFKYNIYIYHNKSREFAGLCALASEKEFQSPYVSFSKQYITYLHK